ncbi:ACGX-repeat peptide [Treponema sp.]|uniref:ACGX-repeat peptide n=1 Tax=Treponema sp. TaxID=166 RepID=UPI00388F01D3
MALKNLSDWNVKMAQADEGSACGTACGASEPEKKPAACGSACGAGEPAEPEKKPAACGSACGAGK